MKNKITICALFSLIFLCLLPLFGLAQTNQNKQTDNAVKPTSVNAPIPDFNPRLNVNMNDKIVGKKASLSASATGGSGNFTYKFVVSSDNWKSWTILSKTSLTKDIVFTPKKPGKYELVVDIADVKTGKIKSTSQIINVEMGWQPNMNLSASNINVGTLVNITAGTTNSSGKYKYKFVWSMGNNWQKWGVISKLGDKNTATFTPTVPGDYSIYVDVIDSHGNVITINKKIKVNLGWQPNMSLSATNMNVGTLVNIAASTTNSSGKYKYKFVWSMGNNWQKWGVISKFGDKNTATFTPTVPGDYSIHVDTIDSYGNVITINKKIKVNRGWDFSLSSSVQNSLITSIKNGKATITVKPTNDFGDVKYKYVWSRGNNWQEWGIISSASKQTTISFETSRYGNYEIYVDAIDRYGNVVTRTTKFNFTTDWNADQPAIFMTPARPGSTMKITGKANKYLPGVRYKFVYSYNNWQEWGVIQHLSTNNTANFVPRKSGKYDIYVDVYDSKGNIKTSSKSANISNKLRLVVNLRTQVVSALAPNLDGNYSYSIRNMVCSTGKTSGTTPTGNFAIMQQYRWRQLQGGVWGQWSSRIVGGILFHSVPYRSARPNTLVTNYYNNLGHPASAGCVRLTSIDAKWIYDNCPIGTPVQIGNFYNSYLPGKISIRRIKSSTNWDPTDPTPGNPFFGKGYL